MKFTNFLLGTFFGFGSHYLYRYYNPQRSISMSSRQLIQAYTHSHHLDENYILSIIKSLGIMNRAFYHFGMDRKLKGFAYNQTFLSQQESKNNFESGVNRIYCIFSPNDTICGHPQIQHGGATATIIDQNMGYLALLHSRSPVATAELSINYKRPVKKGQFYVFEANVSKRQGRRIFLSGKIKQLETGEVKVESSALFMTVDWDNTSSRVLTNLFKLIDKPRHEAEYNNNPKE